MPNERFAERLAALQSEYEAGQKMLADLEARRANLSSTLLRIEGAMQVLRELIDQEKGSAPPAKLVSSD